MALNFKKVIASYRFPFTYIVLEDNIAYDNDDYGVAGITLYNALDREVQTAAYGHGADWSDRDKSVEYAEAVRRFPDLILEIKTALVDKWFNNPKYMGQYISQNDTDINLPCTINGGRKAKGKSGYLLSKETRYNEYLASHYGSRFARNNAVEIGYVYIPEDNAIYEINTDYIQVDYTKAFEAAAVAIRENIIRDARVSVQTLAHLEAYKMSYASIDSAKLNSSLADLIRTHYEAPTLNIPTDVKNVDEEKRNAKAAAKQQKIYETKLPKILAWAKTVGKTPDEVKLIVNRTMKKYNYFPVGVTSVDWTGIEI